MILVKIAYEKLKFDNKKPRHPVGVFRI